MNTGGTWICAATATGKTGAPRIQKESFSTAGAPVFLAGMKGDLSRLALVMPVGRSAESRLARSLIRAFFR